MLDSMQNLFINELIADPIYFFRYVIIIIGSIVIHELAHGLAALSQGDDTPKISGHITANPIVHMGWTSIIFLLFSGMAWGLMPVNPDKFRHKRWSDMLVSAAGPLSNVLLGTLATLLAVVSIRSGSTVISDKFCLMAAQINFLLFALNILPVPPLDGFHVYSQLFPSLKKLERAEISLFLLFVLFSVPAVGIGLNAVSDSMVNAIVTPLIGGRLG
jgi:Zn-dependent protease